ncbi:uncharacterized protein NPIL_650171 [Nephila pilipes]|uniref:Gustatory receptor n=1 Tax=Nephila pilipes TaxID=299642 RepID=A0A8X6P0M0_NEPPI|nr:uncharacterized protein NPIL_650171 [Nephila pilipes]
MRSDFYPVFSIATYLGVSFPAHCDDKETESKTDSNTNFRKYYDVLITVITFIALVITIIFAHNFTTTKVMTLTYSVKYVAAFCIRCYMVLDNHKIPQVIKILSQLYGDISLSVYKSLKSKIYIQCLVLTLFNVILLALTGMRVMCEDNIQNYSSVEIFGRNITADGTINIMHILVASYMVNYCFSVFTVAVSILACCNVHLILRRLIKCYGDSLVQNIKNNSTKESFTEEFSTFRRIIYAMNEADDAMSFIVFFTYVTCISCFFNTLSIFLSKDSIYGHPYLTAEMAVTFMFSVLIFITMTVSAAEVSTTGERLKHRVMCISDIVMQRNLPTDALMNFTILTDNIKSADISMTGWGMFTITRGFVLTTVGVLITYGVLLFQFG